MQANRHSFALKRSNLRFTAPLLAAGHRRFQSHFAPSPPLFHLERAPVSAAPRPGYPSWDWSRIGKDPRACPRNTCADTSPELTPHPDLQKKSAEEPLQGLDSLPADIRTTVRNNAGGHVNHSHLWKTLKNPGEKPSGKLAKEIDQTFGNYDKWKEEMTKTALGIFGSGWAWFARGKDGKLFIKPYPNQDSPVMEGATLIYGIDVWEHAYYLKYRNLRADYVKACLEISSFLT